MRPAFSPAELSTTPVAGSKVTSLASPPTAVHCVADEHDTAYVAWAVSIPVTTAPPGAAGSKFTSLPLELTATQPAARQATDWRGPALRAVSPGDASVPVCG